MTKRTISLLLALWIALLPFLGFPITWFKGLIVASGLILAFLIAFK